jgi:hypothetical protein
MGRRGDQTGAGVKRNRRWRSGKQPVGKPESGERWEIMNVECKTMNYGRAHAEGAEDAEVGKG